MASLRRDMNHTVGAQPREAPALIARATRYVKADANYGVPTKISHAAALPPLSGEVARAQRETERSFPRSRQPTVNRPLSCNPAASPNSHFLLRH